MLLVIMMIEFNNYVDGFNNHDYEEFDNDEFNDTDKLEYNSNKKQNHYSGKSGSYFPNYTTYLLFLWVIKYQIGMYIIIYILKITFDILY